MNIFEEARKKISAPLIESFFFSAGAYWENGEYWTLSPLRADKRIGSFSISEDGRWWDFANDEGGDFFELISRVKNCSTKEAAEKILEAAGITPEASSGRRSGSKKRPDKPDPVIPIPEEAKRELNKMIRSQWTTDRYGTASAAWRYHTSKGEWCFGVVRFDNSSNQKSVVPYYYGTDGKWHQGNPYRDNRPLYRLHEILNSKKTVIIVEGEKCAGIKVQGYIVTTWPGGSSAVNKADWSPLAKRTVVMWPDADGAGTKAKNAICKRLPQAKYVDVSDHGDGWDIADAAAEGIDLVKFIRGRLTEQVEKKDYSSWPFRPLGFTETHHYYLLQDEKIPFSIQRGTWRNAVFLELAPLSWWGNQGLVTDRGVKTAQAQDLLMGESKEIGRYYPEMLRGAGVWRDDYGEIIVNDGCKIITPKGEAIPLNKHKGNGHHYLSSDARFGDLSGEVASAEDGEALYLLFETQMFAVPIMALLTLGWALIAPFGGALHWRPHLWLTGPRGSGKSYVIEHLIKPLCGPFSYHGSGKDSEAGIRRSLRTDARPVLLDEMEPGAGNRSREKILEKLELARNASSDSSGYITIAKQGSGGVDQFIIRSMFCCASVNIPSFGAAINSRFTRCELRRSSDAVKKKKTKEFLSSCGDLSKFRKRIFHQLPQIIEDIEWLRDQLPAVLGGLREADQYAPFFAAVWAVTSDESIQCEPGQDWLDRSLTEMNSLSEDLPEDEDRVIEHILAAQVMTDDKTSRTVGELVEKAAQSYADDPVFKAQDILSRCGLRFIDRDDLKALAIATRSDKIDEWLRGTPYEGSYDSQLRRNSTCLNQDETDGIRFAIGRRRARLFDWDAFKEVYLSGGEE